MLADPDSKNHQRPTASSITRHRHAERIRPPRLFLIDSKGVHQEKFFEGQNRERLTGTGIIAKLFHESARKSTDTGDAPHLKLALEQSDARGVTGKAKHCFYEERASGSPDVHVLRARQQAKALQAR